MKDKIFGILQRIGRSFMLPIAILPVAGLLLGIGGSFTNDTMIRAYHLERLLGEGTLFNGFLNILNSCGTIVFTNLPLLFAIGVAIGMAKQEKEVAALASVISFFIMHTAIHAMLVRSGHLVTVPDAADAGGVPLTDLVSTVERSVGLLDGSVTKVLGITSLEMGVFGGVIVGLGVAALHNRYYKIRLPQVLSFFGGTRFVPIISSLVFIFVGIAMYFVWPIIQKGIYGLGALVNSSGYLGTWIYGILERALIPFGLHHVFYMPFWQTAVGGQLEVGGQLIYGAQNIFFAQLAHISEITHFSVNPGTRFMAGKFPFMIFGLPGAALAMYQTAKPEKKKEAGGLLLSAALTAMLTGITEPIEFTFIFTAPFLYAIHCVLAGAAYMLMHLLQVGVGMTFSGGIIDLVLFGILPGAQKTSWYWIPVVGVIYFGVYDFLFQYLILKKDLKTPGREASEKVRLYTRKDVTAGNQENFVSAKEDQERSRMILEGLGGKNNVADVDCCATRLRCTVHQPELVDELLLKQSGAAGVLKSGNGIQVIYGPTVSNIKADLVSYMETATEEADASKKADIPLYSPFAGRVERIEHVQDETFAKKMVGDGYMVMPSIGRAVAPCDAEVAFVFPTGHAMGLKTPDGMEWMLHIGVDTVKLEGAGFEPLVKAGDSVKAGDILIKFDLAYIEKHAASAACIVVYTALPAGARIEALEGQTVEALERAAELKW